MKVAFYTLGCKVNIYETENVEKEFKNRGYEIVSFDELADVYVINTCSVTNTSDQKSRKIIRSCKKKNKDAIIIAMGCYTQIKYEEASKIDGVKIVIGNKYKNEVVDLLEEYLKTKKSIVKIKKLNREKFEDMKISNFENHTRAFIKVQDGCNNFCSYCIIPYTRGNIRSKNKDDVINEVKELAKNGYKEIVLTGIDTGHYGLDIKDYDFSDLLNDLEKIDGIERIRISSVEITDLNDKFLQTLKNSKKIVDHIHIPLQSGCDKILKLMNRKYDLEFFFKKINEIRSIRKDMAITTDVIVGFPGETDEDFNDTVNTIKKVGFTELHVFPYSKREGTKAATMSNQVDGLVKKDRVRKLISLSNELKETYYKKFLGNKMEVLVEQNIDGYFIGHLSNYGKVKFVSDVREENKIVDVKLLKYENDVFYGEKLQNN